MTRYPARTSEPVSWALMRQEWNDLLFVHWPVPAEVVQARLPEGVTADIYGGTAWVGLVAFHMERVGSWRVRVPYLGSFPETNVRTYVRGPDGQPGVWFDSLDISRSIPALVARISYGLPYMWSHMRITRAGATRTYECRRRLGGPRASSRLVADIGEAIPSAAVSPIERFLTCRWGLYSRYSSRLLYAPVEHPEWPLHRATLQEMDDSLSTVAGYPGPEGTPLVHWTPGVQVRIGRPRWVTVPEWAPREVRVGSVAG